MVSCTAHQPHASLGVALLADNLAVHDAVYLRSHIGRRLAANGVPEYLIGKYTPIIWPGLRWIGTEDALRPPVLFAFSQGASP